MDETDKMNSHPEEGILHECAGMNLVSKPENTLLVNELLSRHIPAKGRRHICMAVHVQARQQIKSKMFRGPPSSRHLARGQCAQGRHPTSGLRSLLSHAPLQGV
ncbi:uncharacterized protein M6G45_004201 isoform 1-T1 [Spheniscus humboldti]